MTTTTKNRKTAPTAEQREQWAEERKAKVAAARQQIADAVSGITSSAEWKDFLRYAASFHRYSFNNLWLIRIQLAMRNMQPPTRVASFNNWSKIKHPVRKGEKGLSIFAPIIVAADPKRDPKYYPGKTVLVGFKIVSTFDAQQVTDPETLPSDPTLGLFSGAVGGEVPAGMWDAMIGFAKSKGYSFRFAGKSVLGSAEGHTDEQAHEIVVHERHEGTVRAALIMLHEITHMVLHTGKDEDGAALFNYAAHRGMAETEAEGTAFVVATYFGIDPGQTSAGYVANWAQDDPQAIVKAGTRIMSTAKTLIDTFAKAMRSDDDNDPEE